MVLLSDGRLWAGKNPEFSKGEDQGTGTILRLLYQSPVSSAAAQVQNYRRHSIVVVGDDEDRALGFGPPLPPSSSSAEASSAPSGGGSGGKGCREAGRTQQVTALCWPDLLIGEGDG